jgi:hypothetical protein
MTQHKHDQGDHPKHDDSRGIQRRSLLQGGALALLLGRADIAWGASIVAVRVWPAAAYTRVTIESDTALKTVPIFVANPPRLAVDIEGIELNPALKELVGKVRSDDPYITGVRVGDAVASAAASTNGIRLSHILCVGSTAATTARTSPSTSPRVCGRRCL